MINVDALIGDTVEMIDGIKVKVQDVLEPNILIVQIEADHVSAYTLSHFNLTKKQAEKVFDKGKGWI